MMDVSELNEFARKIEACRNDLVPYAEKVLEEIGEEFLDLVQAEIQGNQNVDRGKLLASFTKGGAGNIYQLGGLSLTIGSSVEYAKFVNDGHRQQPGRFVPGVWEGSHFRYIPGAKTGMVLKASFVPGSHFFDKSEDAFEIMAPQLAQKAFQQFFARYFS